VPVGAPLPLRRLVYSTRNQRNQQFARVPARVQGFVDGSKTVQNGRERSGVIRPTMTLFRLQLLLAMVLMSAITSSADVRTATADQIRNRIEASVQKDEIRAGRARTYAVETLRQFYETRVFAPAWFDSLDPGVRDERVVPLRQRLRTTEDLVSPLSGDDTLFDRATEQTVRLTVPIDVHLLYWTAWVDPDGSVQFRQDIYDRDKPLRQALNERPPVEGP